MTPSEPHDFADRLGHELRTPLTAIRGYAEALRDEAPPELPAEQRAWVEAILRGVVRMQDAMDRLEGELRECAPASANP